MAAVFLGSPLLSDINSLLSPIAEEHFGYVLELICLLSGMESVARELIENGSLTLLYQLFIEAPQSQIRVLRTFARVLERCPLTTVHFFTM
jgi:hypothetical protein